MIPDADQRTAAFRAAVRQEYGSQKIPPRGDMTPEEWIGEEKLMPGALHAYV
jgi:hypothetical protein